MNMNAQQRTPSNNANRGDAAGFAISTVACLDNVKDGGTQRVTR
jgi:hypothetical protein